MIMYNKSTKDRRIFNLIFSSIFIFLITLLILFTQACSFADETENDKFLQGSHDSIPVSFINSANDNTAEQGITGLLNGESVLYDSFNLKLSHNNYFYTNDIDVEIICDIPEAEIYYSVDGSVPTKESSHKYTSPVKFEKGDINTCYVIKVMAYTDDDESHLLTHTYFVSDQISERFTTFVFAISTDNDNLYGYENGILVAGKLRDEWKQAHKKQAPSPPDPANFNIRGKAGERIAYIEVFKPDGECIISQTAGIRVHGGWSRASNKKSIALYARSEYDPNFDKFNYDFFPDNRRNDEYQSFIKSYSTLLLRNGGNDREGAYMREEFLQVLAEKAGFLDHKRVTPACIFLNGEYYGFFWLEEFYSEAYFADYYTSDGRSSIEIGEWEEPYVGNLSDDENFLKYSEIMDLDSYMLYYAFEIYSQNKDWPHNNKKYWRFAGDNGEQLNQYYDGKYRMLLYDVEMGWGMNNDGYKEGTIRRIIRDKSSKSFVALTKRADMTEKFCNQMFDLMNTVFQYDAVESVYYETIAAYESELAVALQSKSINSWMRMSNVKRSQNLILKFAEGRRDAVINDMKLSFKLSGDIYNVNAFGNGNAKITLNTLTAEGGEEINSCYFTEHKVVLKAEPYSGYVFDYWEISGKKYYEPEIILDASMAVEQGIVAELYIKEDETYKNLVISEIRADSDINYIKLINTGVNEFVAENIYISDDKSNLKKFDLSGTEFTSKSVAVYYANSAEAILPFSVQKGGTIYLSDIDGNILQNINITSNLHRNEVIRRQPDGSYKIFKAE